MQTVSIKLLIACKNRDASTALCARLVSVAEGAVLCEPTDLSGVLPRASIAQPDVLLLEHAEADEARTWQTMAALGRVSQGTRVLLLCDDCTDSTLIGSVRRGASGLLFKSSEPMLQVRGVTCVHRGEAWFGRTALLEAIRGLLAIRPSLPAGLPEAHEPLTVREQQILGLVGDALSNKEIARRLMISDNTVKTHLHRIYVKLKQSGRYKAFSHPRSGA